jgi:DNA-binding transcriptional MerR regulator
MHIGAVAKRMGLSARTIRYYEELGLIDPCGHSSGGFRLYGEDTLKRLEIIGFLKGLDLTLSEIRQIFDAGRNPGEGKEGVRQLVDLLGGKLRLLEKKLGVLSKMKTDLKAVLGALHLCESCEQSTILHSQVCSDCIRTHYKQRVPEILEVFLEKDSGRPL